MKHKSKQQPHIPVPCGVDKPVKLHKASSIKGTWNNNGNNDQKKP